MLGKRKWTSKILSFAVAVTVAVSSMIAAPRPAVAAEGPDIQAPVALLVDIKSGQYLYAKGENDKRFPASTTKIMTMLLTLEAVKSGQKKMTDIVPVPLEAYNIEGSSVWLDPKEKFTVKEMLEFVAVPSGNDASTALAIFIAGSEQAFVQKMNEKAKELGMNATHFANSNGLHHPDHYTTAADLAILARELITKHPEILEMTRIKSFEIRGGKNKIENTNLLIGKYEGMDGLKTGFTDEAGYCLVSTAERGGNRLIGVILGAKSDLQRQEDTTKLLDYGYKNFSFKKVAEKGKPVAEKAIVVNAVKPEVEAAPAQDLYVAVKNGEEQAVQTKYVWHQVEAPFGKGQILGQLQQVKDGKVLSSVDLVSTQEVEKGSWLRLFFRKVYASISNSISGLFN
ncbi:D-alanyl-D-alanine carboxypeptidase family protein [Effusibacillus lacus]|uniref:serine-type D-Ala-D-Ala carboxypeptidase n=1 Tax=Effusibacillus lacus TaxID=1348429 RepID=A0A292YC30_9BACL|nr:D-alanyl-D-alanine carboxypeptidase family protein [Effusibacillus lacus]TCS74414.1 penicillin-binding protein 6 [Effusibacillus lacus]GAX88712.1 D-alanyl-D-alanine carboxypeptidase [Effusibacillus lacus]